MNHNIDVSLIVGRRASYRPGFGDSDTIEVVIVGCYINPSSHNLPQIVAYAVANGQVYCDAATRFRVEVAR